MLVRWRGLPQKTFHEKERITVETGCISDKIGIFGIEKFDLVNLVKKNGLPVFNNLRKPDDGNSLPVRGGAINLANQPFSITDQNAGARCKNRNIHRCLLWLMLLY